MKKVLGVLFVGIAVVTTGVVFASYSSDSEYVQAVDWMHQNDMTRYSNSQDFNPGAYVTREQAAKFFSEFSNNILGVNSEGTVSKLSCKFSDEIEADVTLQGYLSSVCTLDLMKGSNGYFRPGDVLTKAEAITVLMRMDGGILNENTNPWRENYYTKAVSQGITKETNVWNLDKPLTRYEMALLLSRAAGNAFRPLVDPDITDIEEILSGIFGVKSE